ncbi:MAG: IclR family mhp operon transcriptional activator [Paracoccaceae bacterium]|jgi:IclR family mhp operon transcriptional activator
MTVYSPVRALERGLELLLAVNAADAIAGITTQGAATATALPRATAYRLLETLQSMGFVAQSPSDGAWRPTLRCQALGAGARDAAWVGQIAAPVMARLAERILWPLDLSAYSDGAMRIRETTHKISPLSFDLGMAGKRIPMLHTSAGHAYLAFCPDEERARILAAMRDSDLPEHALAHDPAAIAMILDRTRARGFGVRTEGFRAHTCSIAMPIRQGGRLLATLTVVCLKSAISLEEMIRSFAPALRDACDEIEAEIAAQA